MAVRWSGCEAIGGGGGCNGCGLGAVMGE